MLLTFAEQAETLAIIEQLHLHFIGYTLGTDLLSAEELATLTAAGFDVATLPAQAQGPLADSFLYGTLSATLGLGALLQLTYPELRQAIARLAGVPFTPQQQASFDYARRLAAQGIKGLGNKLGTSWDQVLIEADQQQRQALEKVIGDETARAILLRQTAPDLSRRLLNLTKDSARDFGRIADFTLHLAFDHGRAADFARRFGPDCWVYKQPLPGACPQCLKLLLEQPTPGAKPRLFTLSALLAGGTNIGRPQAEQKAVVGPQHPWCRCPLYHADPVHYDYDPATQGWTTPKKESVSKRVRAGIKVS